VFRSVARKTEREKSVFPFRVSRLVLENKKQNSEKSSKNSLYKLTTAVGVLSKQRFQILYTSFQKIKAKKPSLHLTAKHSPFIKKIKIKIKILLFLLVWVYADPHLKQ
jgi:hypothetical protein